MSLISMLREGPAFDWVDCRYTQNHFNCADTIRERFAKASAEGPEDAIKRKPNFGWQFLLERKENDSIARHERLSVSELKELTGNVFTGVTCCAGTSIIDIAIDGSVKGMICALDHATCNIYKENPFLRKDWIHGVFCTKPMCGCSVNHRIPKFGSYADAQKFIAGKRLEQKQLLEIYRTN